MDTEWQVFSLGKSKCLAQPTQIKLCPKANIFSHLFSPFLKSRWNFEHFLKKDELHSWCIEETIDWKNRDYLNA